MRIVIQIPCLNEEATIAGTIADIREATRELGDVVVLVVDDGSTDRTVSVAFAGGADHVVRHKINRGLARAYMTGLAVSMNLGADVIVNTDADNQYKASGIPALVRPILDGTADMVVGARPIDDIEHFSPLKKRLQRFGSRMVRFLSHTEVVDATSGFRAISRQTALRLNTLSDYTYTLETLIQAGRSGLRVMSVDIDTNPPTRESRLISSIRKYVMTSSMDMMRVFAVYAPLRAYLIAGSVPLAGTVLLGLRYLFLISFGDPTRTHAPSLILAGIFAGLGFLIVGLGIIGELLAVNRRILEELRLNQRRKDVLEGKVMAQVNYETAKRPEEREA
ncbi:glycosyltransferase family 2 protein [Aliiruegeria sabulilitoris]|uniref:glycosyltransferase family 2 protein n=1 Tax=Aliiruegeria sabulilitoris TaxID=1510458 RepID=UPI000836663F|nr:glycosyltransferase family 2 protein [Aliiruegeria sabulilitoris]NDR56039.1 glycosyltransferase family 2 protein [Pseudoruegeria sp. M32A2M]